MNSWSVRVLGNVSVCSAGSLCVYGHQVLENRHSRSCIFRALRNACGCVIVHWLLFYKRVVQKVV